MDKILMRNVFIGLAVLLTVVAIVMFMMNKTPSPQDNKPTLLNSPKMPDPNAAVNGNATVPGQSGLSPKALQILTDFFYAGIESGNDMLAELVTLDQPITDEFIDKLRLLKQKQNSKDPAAADSADIEMITMLTSSGIDKNELE